MDHFQDVEFNPPENITFSDKCSYMCPFNYTKFYHNDDRQYTNTVCIRDNLTKFKIYYKNLAMAKVDLNPEIMRKLFNFNKVKIEYPNVSYIAAMIYKMTINQTLCKYLINSHFINDVFDSTKLIYGDKNQFCFKYNDDPIRMDLMDSHILKRSGNLYKSLRNLSRLTDKELLNLPHNDPYFEYIHDGSKDKDYELIYRGQMINDKFDTSGSETVGEAYEFAFDDEKGLPNPTVLYKGKWKEGLRHDYGENLYKNGEIYKGNWKNGLKHGEGSETSFPDKNNRYIQEIYEGYYENGKKSGMGKLYNGHIFEEKKLKFDGLWNKDEPIETLSNALPKIPKDVTTILGSFLFKSKRNNLDKSKSKSKKSKSKSKKSKSKSKKSKSKSKKSKSKSKSKSKKKQ
jgi:hypothetical protein